jgi:hypothetical protein
VRSGALLSMILTSVTSVQGPYGARSLALQAKFTPDFRFCCVLFCAQKWPGSR